MNAPRRTPPNARQVSRGRLYEWRTAGLPFDDQPERFWSVTTIIKGALPSRALQEWGMREVASYAVANYRQLYAMLNGSFRITRDDDGRTLMTIEDQDAVAAAIEWLRESPYRERERKADIGSAVHEQAEAHVLGKPMPPIPEKIAGYVDSYRAFLADWAPDYIEFEAEGETLWLAEASVFNRSEAYGGTLDAIMDLPAPYGRCLVDYKTGKGVYHETALQLAAYRHAEFIGLPGGIEWPMPNVDGCAVLHLTQSGYELLPVIADETIFRHFLWARENFRWIEETSKGVIGAPLRAPKREALVAA